MIDDNRRRPTPDELQPDPQLKLSTGRANWMRITMVAAACAVILGLMIYGLNQPTQDGSTAATSPSGQQTTGAAPQPEQPQSGGNVAGGENAEPKQPASKQQTGPAQQPIPEQAKPTTPDDSKR